MPPLAEIFALLKSAAATAGRAVLAETGPGRAYAHAHDNPKEIKALADVVLEQTILEALRPVRLPILSEEAGEIAGDAANGHCFIVDPLDGTLNFVRRLGPSAVSLALWRGATPVFGVIFHLEERRLYWGGLGLGAHVEDEAVTVSRIESPQLGAVCTGFPARLDVTDESRQREMWDVIRPFGKVRMLGSAAISLLHVARGSADAYFEQNIMLWDVAAGLALVEGAGGRVCTRAGTGPHMFDVFASNGQLREPPVFRT